METLPNHGLSAASNRWCGGTQSENAKSKVFATCLIKAFFWKRKRRAKRARKFFDNVRSFIAEKRPYHAIVSQVCLVQSQNSLKIFLFRLILAINLQNQTNFLQSFMLFQMVATRVPVTP